MTTMVGTKNFLKDDIQNYQDELVCMLELELDAVEAYKAACNRLEDANYKNQIAAYQQDHENHIRDLTQMIRGYGKEAPHDPTMKSVLTQGKVVVGALMGDKAILMAMLDNEKDTNTAYERMCSFPHVPEAELSILRKCWADEQKHKAWIESVIE